MIALRSLPAGVQDYVLQTSKLVLFMTVVATVCGFAYGWWKGIQIWIAFSLIVVVAQTWVCRRAIGDFIRSMLR
jgi:hypothetical protein